MDGVAVYELIAARWPTLPIIFSTGHGDESKPRTFLRKPNVRFLMKPYEMKKLFDEIASVVAPEDADRPPRA